MNRVRTAAVVAFSGLAIGLGGVSYGQQSVQAGGGAVAPATPVRLEIPLNRTKKSYVVSDANAAKSAAKRVFDAAPGIEVPGFAVTNQIAVRASSADAVSKALAVRPSGVAAGASVAVAGMGLAGWYVVTTGTVQQAVDLASYLQGTGLFDSVSVDMQRPTENRGLGLNDPRLGDQWHLQNDLNPDADLKVAPVWAMGITGEGIRVGIVEAGEDNFLVTHPDLAGNFNPSLSMAMTPFPVDQFHGTAVAGIIGAVGNNGEGMAGIAYNSDLVAIRNGTDLQTMQAINWQSQRVHIKNNSWGPANAPNPVILHWPSPDYVMDALERAGRFFRSNKGTITVWASGNEGIYLAPTGFGARVDYEALASSRHVIAVGAVGDNNLAASYSATGTSLFVSAYSQGDAGRAIGTTATPTMFNPNRFYTTNFNGTSAAAPVAAGVIALMLEANSSLKIQDVKQILVDTSRVVDFENSDQYWFSTTGISPFGTSYWQVNGGFQRHSDLYGFGVIDAEAAVNAALSWVNKRPPELFDTGVIALGESVPDAEFVEFPPESGAFLLNHVLNGPASVTETICVRPDAVLETIEVIVSAEGDWVGDLMITLQSPYGTVSALALPRPDPDGGYTEFTFTTNKHWGERTAGNWTLTFTDWIPAEPFDDNDGEYTVDLAPWGWDGIDGAGEKTVVSYRVRMYGQRDGQDDFFLCPLLEQSCPGDMNGDGIVDVEDLVLFLNLWEAGDPLADLNEDGVVTYADWLLFFGAWSPGYCDPGPGPGGQNGRPFPNGGTVGTPIGQGGPPAG